MEKDSEKRWKTIFDAITDIVVLLSPEHDIILINKAGADALKTREEELIGKKCFHVVHDTQEPIPDCPCVKALETGKEHFSEYESGGRHYYLSAWPVVSGDGKVEGFTHIVKDITDRKKIELELVEAKSKAEESDRLKSAFLANMSHEIRTPLTGIVGFAEFLKEANLSDEERKQYIEIIQQGSDQLIQIISDIICISKIEAHQETVTLTDVDLHSILDELLFVFQPQASLRNLLLTFTKGFPGENHFIHTDREKLKNILSNLVGNAIKYTDSGRIEVGYKYQNNKLIFSVMDTGIGIEKTLHEAIFDRFRQVEMTYTRNYGGTGLGLSLSKAYVEMLGGKIDVDSTPGKGSTFTFDIPYIFSESVSRQRGWVEPETILAIPDWGTKTILIAEDEPSSALFLKKALQPTGIRF